MKNNKGFTLIELIATITILSIIMLIAVPNMISVMNKNKNQTYINDARKMVTLAKYKFESDASINRPTAGSCIIMKLRSLDRSELNKGPENGIYDLDESFVVINYENQTYKYRVQIVENYTKNNSSLKKGVKLANYSDIIKTDSKNQYIDTTGFKTATLSDYVNYGCSNSNTVVYPLS